MKNQASLRVTAWLFALGCSITPAWAQSPQTLPGTQPLTMEGDIASQMIDGVDKFLLRKLEESPRRRAELLDDEEILTPEALAKKYGFRGFQLDKILGVVDERVAFDGPQLIATPSRPALVGKGQGFDIYAIQWPVLYDPQPDRRLVSMHGEGLLLVPTGREPVADIIAIPHCDHTPEQIVGLAPGLAPESQYARRFAEAGCRVVVPTLINREDYIPHLTHREFIYRSAFELGRHIIGYEVQKVLAIVDWFEHDDNKRRIGVVGYGDGGMLALYAGALDKRIDVTCASGYVAPREHMWSEPIDRNVFGRLVRYGETNLAEMTHLIIEHAPAPKRTFEGGRGAPAAIVDITKEQAGSVLDPLRGFAIRRTEHVLLEHDPFTCQPARVLETLLGAQGAKLPALGDAPKWVVDPIDAAARHERQFLEMDRHNQSLLREAEVKRTAFMKKLYDTIPKGLDEYNKVAAEYRRVFRDEVIGSFDDKRLPFNARSRLDAETEKWTRYEVVLDVFPDVFAYGLLIIPKHMKDGEKRPVVVCQHGLEGRPQSVIGDEQKQYYKAFATELAERGFITFAPQNIYIFHDRFRTLQRKANPLGKTLFSIMVPQHQQITDWLKTQPFVDGNRIGFYGLSYGGKSAMRIPALVDNYCLSICSADFNEWVWKNAATSTFANGYTYANKNEYEIFEWDLGSTFNYAEMAALIAPRPFMVERGHDDGVAPDETVAYEYSKIRRFYDKLGIGDRTRIEFFNGPHSIHGVGTYEFLHKHLNWPMESGKVGR